MSSKVISLVLLGATLAFAQQSKVNQDDAVIKAFFNTEDPRTHRAQWDYLLKRATYVLESGKQAGIQRAGRGQVEAVVKGWLAVEEQGVAHQNEAYKIINALRKTALAKRPAVWAQAAQISSDYFEDFKRTVATGNVQAVLNSQVEGMNSLRQLDSSLRAELASRNYHVPI